MKKNTQEKPLLKISNMKELLLKYFQKHIEINTLTTYLNDPKIKKDLHNPLRLQRTNQEGRSAFPLEWALIYEDWKLTKVLLDAGTKPDLGIEYPIFLAIINFAVAETDKESLNARIMLKLLKDKGVNIDVKLKRSEKGQENITGNGIVDLIMMIGKNVAPTVKNIIEIFPDIQLNDFNSDGTTPLIEAISHNYLPLVELLCSHNVPLTPVIYNKKAVIPFVLAMKNQNENMLEFILQRMLKNPFPDMARIMQRELEANFSQLSINIIRLLLQTNLINVNNYYSVPANKGKLAYEWTLMHQACKRGDRAIVDLLINHGGLINTKDKDVNKPIAFAINYNQIKLISWLLDSDILNDESIRAGLMMCNLLKNTETCREMITSKYVSKNKLEINNNFCNEDSLDGQRRLPILESIIIRDNPHDVEIFSTKFNIEETPAVHAYFHLAIKNNSVHSVKYFLSFCNPFFELDNKSAIFIAILEKSQTIMEMFVHHYRDKLKIKDLENYLLRCESLITNMSDPEQYLLFLKKIHQFYFQEAKPVSFDFFQSASSHQFLKEQGMKMECPVIPKIVDNKNMLFKPERKMDEPTWFGGQLIDLKALKPVEGTIGYEAFVFLLKEETYAASGCSQEEFKKFNATRCSFTAGSANIKKITLDYFIPCTINGYAQTIQCSHELRIKGRKERILLIPVLSDCKRYNILVGAEYCEGLHKTAETMNLLNSNRHGTKSVKITLPAISTQLSLDNN